MKSIRKIVHFQRNSQPYHSFLFSACGVWLGGEYHSPFKSKITCKNCKRTKFFKWCKDPDKKGREAYEKRRRELVDGIYD